MANISLVGLTEKVIVGVILLAIGAWWGDGAPALAAVDSAVATFGGVDRIWTDALYPAALALLAAAVAIQVGRWFHIGRDGLPFWQFELRMPSWPTTMLGASAAAALVGRGLDLCADGSPWGLIPISGAALVIIRFAARLRHGFRVAGSHGYL